MKEQIYLDNNSTTPLDPRIAQTMTSDLSGPPANPSSVHFFGQRAKNLLNEARAAVAAFFKAKSEEIIFTSGGTESINLLLRGLPKGHLITTDLDHSCVYKTAQALEAQGTPVTYLAPGLWGAPTPDQLAAAIRPDTKAIILTLSNGETGIKLDLEPLASLAARHAIPLFLDAVSYIGKEPLSLPPSIAGAAISGHKIYAPKGIGALYLRSHIQLTPLFTGGNQENKRRAGSENLAGARALAQALQILSEEQTEITQHLLALRTHFETELQRHLSDVQVNGLGPRICNTSNLAFHGCDGETLLLQLDLAGIAASHGSACSSGALEPSRVLLKMGIDRKTARNSVRFSFGRQNTRAEVDQALERIIPLVKKMRALYTARD